jgi:uncharacterized protein YkwD
MTAPHTRAVWLTALLTGLAAVAAVLAPAPAGARTGSAGATVYHASVRVATNAERVERGRVPLVGQACVQRYAVRQATRMARQERMFHQDLRRVLKDCGLRKAGENVAYGYDTGQAVVRAWMRSPGHRRNVLDREYRLLGVGARQADDGTWYAAQVFGRRA